MTARPVILDVDTGVDDALAILLAVTCPGLDVRAITCVAGNVGLDQVLANTLAVLEAAGRGDIPVAAGADRPLVNPPRSASYVHGTDGLGGVPVPAPTRPASDLHAVELMRRVLMESATPVTIVALAPLTNIALLLRMHPEVTARIAHILFMGGSAGVGNATAVAEFNTWHDPEAAAIVVGAPVPVTMYGLDVFYAARVSDDQVADLGASDSPAARLAAQLLRTDACSGSASQGPTAGACLGDAGAVCTLIDPDGADIRHLPVDINLQAGPGRGQTIFDRRTFLPPGQEQPRTIGVTLGIDHQRYAALFTRTLRAAHKSAD